jgi:exopolyphosphatase
LSLRPELKPALSRARLVSDDLITISDLPPTREWKSKLNPQDTKWLLVDHNDLNGELGKVYADRVMGVIDHHDEENKVPKDNGDEPRVIQKCGSCTSLVIRYYQDAWDAAAAKSQTADLSTWDRELAYMALAPILMDTANLKDASKVTSTDVEAVNYLESRLSGSQEQYNRDDYFDELASAKAAIGKLSADEILRKDYKQWTESGSFNLGISGVAQDMEWYVEKAGGHEAFLETVHRFATERDLSLHAIMTTATVNGKFQRVLFLYARNELGCKACKTFEEDTAAELGLTPWGDGKLDGQGSDPQTQQVWKCWNQAAIEKSRKQVGPVLRAAVNKSLARS